MAADASATQRRSASPTRSEATIWSGRRDGGRAKRRPAGRSGSFQSTASARTQCDCRVGIGFALKERSDDLERGPGWRPSEAMAGRPIGIVPEHCVRRTQCDCRSRSASPMRSEATIWWSRSGSNRRPLECHSSALPAELRPQSRPVCVARGTGPRRRDAKAQSSHALAPRQRDAREWPTSSSVLEGRRYCPAEPPPRASRRRFMISPFSSSDRVSQSRLKRSLIMRLMRAWRLPNQPSSALGT